MDSRVQIIVKHKIQEIIFQAQIGNFAFPEVPNQAGYNHPSTVPGSQIATGRTQGYMDMLHSGNW